MHEDAVPNPPPGPRESAADYSVMGREVNAPGVADPHGSSHSFFAATPRGGSMDALKMSTALR